MKIKPSHTGKTFTTLGFGYSFSNVRKTTNGLTEFAVGAVPSVQSSDRPAIAILKSRATIAIHPESLLHRNSERIYVVDNGGEWKPTIFLNLTKRRKHSIQTPIITSYYSYF